MSEILKKMNEMEDLKNELKNQELTLGAYKNWEDRVSSETSWKLWGNEIHNQRKAWPKEITGVIWSREK